MITIAVCDDDASSVKRTVSLIDKWALQSGAPVSILECGNGDELISKSAAVRIDLIFLDIIMPLLNGMDTAKELRADDKSLRIVFLTSSPEFALESYEVKAADYIVKPAEYGRIKAVLDEYCRSVNLEAKNIVLKTDSGFQKVYLRDIESAEAQNKRVIIHLREGRLLEAAEQFYSIEKRLIRNDGFFKCHRSYIVYLPNVDHCTLNEITMISGQKIPISRGCGKAFQEAFFSAIFND